MENSDSAPLTRYVLKDGDSFLVANSLGDIVAPAEGFFVHDTRIVSRYEFLLGEQQPALLSSAVTQDNVLFVAHLTNRALSAMDEMGAPEGLIHITRSRFLCRERMYERITCMNYGDRTTRLPLRFRLDADFVDMFEVRGSRRPARGRLLGPESSEWGYAFRYEGLDGVARSSSVLFSRPPAQPVPGCVEFVLTLAPGGSEELYAEIGVLQEATPSRQRYRDEASHARRHMRRRQRRGARVSSSGPLFDQWMRRSRSDLALLTSELETGPYPYAGIPWFSTPFGRDAVITAMQTLWLDPGLAKGVLTFLARHQAKEESPFLDAAPGKIMHETRRGEMSAMKELPFGLYYGGVDTTPLFIALAGAYLKRTADIETVQSLWPALLAAVQWIERVCDADPNGLLVYARASDRGLANQGWKDSGDSVFHADGRLAEGPIALVEVQGYAYAALRTMAELGQRWDPPAAAHWARRAQALRATIERRFWMESAAYYGLALDGEGALCAVRTSNAGHLLQFGVAEPARALAVAEQLMSPAFFTGWGIRTVARGEARFNPISYHNGSVWPHDSALCASGLASTGVRGAATRLLRGAFEAAVHFDMRMPELFCGFARTQGAPPVAYPVACLPQAWAAGSAFMLLQACLGIQVDGDGRTIHVQRAELPFGIQDVTIHDLAVGDQRIDLAFRSTGSRVAAFIEGDPDGRVSLQVRG
ncbi:amylo-alpha-1,6-glucosidase [Pseudoxanthomonas sp. F37]|jgi:glycogen debranching enzyme|uniref:amylo-alpha-1,6-glucosidase n=1 Tax=Pseudoxanthomonas sp. F37 TaxID=2932492 RepID=UPI001FD0DFA1|nr:amylo-alpha-1,6-glucosidase [Pseudoxanthomonas sp. F37]UOV10410.1 amylo-alpha-1,6-glucosidase [Pseudoxanthomonas sp. F37]